MTELKTLKDYENKFRDIEKFMQTHIVDKMFKDNNIEFKLIPIDDVKIPIKELRQEAKKWIKKLQKLDEEQIMDEELIKYASVTYIRCHGDMYDYEGTINWIKEFFNITEDEIDGKEIPKQEP